MVFCYSTPSTLRIIISVLQTKTLRVTGSSLTLVWCQTWTTYATLLLCPRMWERHGFLLLLEPASRPKPEMTKCEDSVCRIRGRNWPKSRNKEMSQVTVHPIGFSQLQIQSVTGGAKSSYAGDSQAKDSTATCLVLWFLISSGSNPGWHPPHLCPLCVISIKLDWTTLSEECTRKQESHSRTISWPLSGYVPGTYILYEYI